MTKIRFLFLIAVNIIPLYLASQNKPLDWSLYSEENGIQIYYKYQECHIVNEGIFQEWVLLRFLNTNNINLKISWQTNYFYSGGNNIINTSDGIENTFTIHLEAGQLVEGICDLNTHKELKIFSKFLNYDNKPELIKFEIKKIRVTPF